MLGRPRVCVGQRAHAYPLVHVQCLLIWLIWFYLAHRVCGDGMCVCVCLRARARACGCLSDGPYGTTLMNPNGECT